MRMIMVITTVGPNFVDSGSALSSYCCCAKHMLKVSLLAQVAAVKAAARPHGMRMVMVITSMGIAFTFDSAIQKGVEFKFDWREQVAAVKAAARPHGMRMVMVITSMGPDSQAGGFAEDRIAALCRQAAVERRCIRRPKVLCLKG